MSTSDDIDSDSGMLLDEQLTPWRERDIPLHDRGIRLSWLIAFVENIYATTNDPLLSTYRDQLMEYDRAVAQQRASL